MRNEQFGSLIPNESLAKIGQFSDESAIGHDGVLKTSTFEIQPNRSSEVGGGEEGVVQDGSGKVSFSEFGTSKVTSRQVGSSKVGFSQVGIFKPGSVEETFSHVRSGKTSTSQVRHWHLNLLHESFGKASTNQANAFTLRFEEVGSSQVHAVQFGTVENRPFKVGSSEINRNSQLEQVFPTEVTVSQIKTGLPTSSSIPFQYLFSSHNSNLQNIAGTSWNNLLPSSAKFNLGLAIADLPTSQLAEAQLTRFDADGKPIVGTIPIDDNANGLGWFIDPTPWESSEFSTQNKAYNLQATEAFV